MKGDVTILAVGAYVPRTRIERKTIADVWGAPVVPGARALAGTDEDTVTMAVEAARSCLGTLERSEVDAIYFASTTSPYAEKQAAALIAAALDLPTAIATIDFGGTLRAGTSALRAARDAVSSGAAKRILVVAADKRPAEPESVYEQLYGDGAAALVVGGDEPGALARIDAIDSIADDVSAGWRRTEDAHVRSFNPKHELEYGYAGPLRTVLSRLIATHGLEGARLAVPSPDGRAHLKLGRSLGIPKDRIADPLSLQIGVLGTCGPFIALVGAIEGAEIGDKVLLGAGGEGADGAVLTVMGTLPVAAWRQERIDEATVVASYGDFVRTNNLMVLSSPDIPSSPVQFWRDRKQFLNLRGMRCGRCTLVQYPIGRFCARCKTQDQLREVPLSRTGKVFSYTGDHIVASTYSTKPLVRALVDIDGGGRILTSIVDCSLDEVRVGMTVELVFRRSHDGGDFLNYYWKARPTASSEIKEGAA